MTAAGTVQSGTPPSWKPLSSSHLQQQRDRRLGHRADDGAGEGDHEAALGCSRSTARCGARRSRSGDAGVVMAAIIGRAFEAGPAAYNRPRLSTRPHARPPALGHPHHEERVGAASRPAWPRWRSPTNGSSSTRPSSDDTAERARRLGAQVFTSTDWPGFGAQKQRALDRATGRWVLVDRRRRAGLRPSSPRASAHGDLRRERRGPVAYELSRLSRFCGRWIRHGDWYPDRVLRLFRRDRARFSAGSGARAGRSSRAAGRPARRRTAARHHADAGRRPRQDEPLQQRERGPARRRGAARRPRRGARPRPSGRSCAATSSGGAFSTAPPASSLAAYVAEGTYWRYLKIAELARGLPTEADPRRSCSEPTAVLRVRPIHAHRRRVFCAAAGRVPRRPGRAQFKVEISGVGATQLPIAIARFRDEDRSGQSPSAHHPRRPRAQRRLPRHRQLGQRSTRPARRRWGEWRARAADALVGGSAARLADGRFDLRFKLWDVVKGADLGGQSNAVEAAELRLGAHRIADYIYEKLTGEKGVFSTRIAYVTRAGSRHTLRVADADGVNGQVALNSGQPIISPAWSPNGKELAYVSFEKQKAVVFVHSVATGERRAIADFRGSNSAPAWSTGRPDAGGDAVARGRLAALPDRHERREPAPHHDQPGDRHRGRVLAPTAAGSTSPATAAAARRSTACRRAAATPSASPSPAATTSARRSAPTAARSRTSRAAATRSAWRRSTCRAAARSRRRSPTPRRRASELRAQRPAAHLRHTAQGRSVLMTTTLDGKIKARLPSATADLREPVWGPFGR